MVLPDVVNQGLDGCDRVVSHSPYRPGTRDATGGVMMSDHREDIFEASKRYTAGARERVTEEAQETGEELAYDAEIFWSSHGRRRVEFLLAGGGPTVWVLVDQDDSVTFEHSWGCCICRNCRGEGFLGVSVGGDGPDIKCQWCNGTGAEDATLVELYGEDAEFWIDQADDWAEMARHHVGPVPA